MRSFLPMILAVMAAIALPRPAHAEDGTCESCAVPMPSTDDPPKDRLEARFGAGFITGSSPHLTMRRADVGAGIMYFPGGLDIALGTGIHFGPSFLLLDGPLVEGLGLDASLVHWTNLSLDAKIEWKVYDKGRLSFDLYGGFEMSAFDDRLQFSRADLETGQGTFDVSPFLNKHIDLRYGWSRMEASVIAKVRLGPFTPRLGIGFQRMLLRVTAETDDEGKFVLANLSDKTGSIERLYEEDFTMIRLAPGLDLRVARKLAFSLEGFFMPTGEGAFWGSTLGTHITF